MSISNISHASPWLAVKVAAAQAQAHAQQVQANKPSGFAAYLEQASAVEQVGAVTRGTNASAAAATTNGTATTMNPVLQQATASNSPALYGKQDQAAGVGATAHGLQQTFSAAASGAEFAQVLSAAQQQLGTNSTIVGNSHPLSAYWSQQDGGVASAGATYSSASQELTAKAQALTLAQIRAQRAALEEGPLGVNPQNSSAEAILNATEAISPEAASAAASVDSSTAAALMSSNTASGGSIIEPSLARAHALSADAAQVIRTIEAVNVFYEAERAKEAAAAREQSSDLQVVSLADKTLDFSAMLPAGMRSFLQELRCSESEINDFVNVVVFGSAQGPHGHNAAQFLGQESIMGAQLKDKLQSLLDSAHINSTALERGDFDFVLRPQGQGLGQTLAVNNGADLEARTIERELDNTFKRDMALLQVMSRSNNQSASLF